MSHSCTNQNIQTLFWLSRKLRLNLCIISQQGLAGGTGFSNHQHARLLLLPRAALGNTSILFRITLNKKNKASGFRHRYTEILKTDIFNSKFHLQVEKMGTGAIAISLPFSCILGLLASMTASTMGRYSFEKYSFPIGSSTLIRFIGFEKILCSYEKICVDLRICSVCFGRSLRPYILLRG